MSCRKAQEFLETNAVQVADQTDARKERKGRAEALALARTVARVVVARGKQVLVFDMVADPPNDDTLLAHLLGPTGNLKAPTLRKGDTLLVGFGETAYRQVLAPARP
jgi:hypothetical protein